MGWSRVEACKEQNLVVDLVVIYGGGYNRDREHTARLHADSVLRAACAARSWHTS